MREAVAQRAILQSRKRPGVLSCAVRGVRNAWKTVQWTVFSEERVEAPGTRNSARGARANPYRNEQCEALQASSATIEVAEHVYMGQSAHKNITFRRGAREAMSQYDIC